MAFPIDRHESHDPCKRPPSCPLPYPLLVEPIIVHKIYDSCRAQDCLETVAFAAEAVHINDEDIHAGDVLPVPHGADSVEMDGLKIKRINIDNKTPSPFKRGFWDVDVRFEFEYTLTFYDCSGEVILCVGAFSAYKKRYHLFGSVGTDMKTATDFGDFMSSPSNSEESPGSAPFAMAEAKAIALRAGFRRNHRERVPADVFVTIGLFSTMKLFRAVCLNVESSGFCIPKECEDACPANPCEFFSNLEFPADIFAPPET